MCGANKTYLVCVMFHSTQTLWPCNFNLGLFEMKNISNTFGSWRQVIPERENTNLTTTLLIGFS